MDPASDAAMAKMRRRLHVTSVSYWRGLVPDCTIEDDPFRVLPPYAVSAADAARFTRQIRHEGYFQTEPLLETSEIERLRACVERVTEAGHHAIYALLYDDFYQVLGRLGAVLAPVLGDGFQLVPDECGGFYVPADDHAAGSAPHRDNLRTEASVEPDGTPTLVNVWIPLTDVAPPGSCMYVVPAHADPSYPKGGRIEVPQDHDAMLCGADLQTVRALPARAGSVICWSAHLLHWGARSSAMATGPRMSFACYFQSRRVPPYHAVTMDIPSPIPFDYRLYLLEKMRRVTEEPKQGP